MSFKLGRFFYLTISFIIGTFFFVIGAFGIILPWSPYLQQITTHFIYHHTLILSLFGLGFALTGLSMVVYSILNSRRRYVQIRTGDLGVVLDENIIRDYLEKYWENAFPNSQISYNLYFKKHSLRIAADLPYLSLTDQRIFLERLKEDFNDIFGRILGYPYDVHFIASFQDRKE